MWRKEEAKPQGAPQPANVPAVGFAQPVVKSSPETAASSSPATSAPLPISARATACITQGIKIKGEIICKEDLFVDGTLEGKLDIGNALVTIGPNGKVKADISAREIVVRGQVEGKLEATERVQLWNTGRVSGEVRTERLAIEDGAVLRGKVEAGKLNARANESRSKNTATETPKSNSAAASSSQSAVI